VHRVIESHTTCIAPTAQLRAAAHGRNTTQLLLTKGDNNDSDDIGLYKGRKWIEREHIIGKVRG
jgi:signal peptidase